MKRLALLMLWSLSLASVELSSAATSYNISVGNTQTIDEHGISKEVSNNDTYNVYVPTATLSEWQTFLANLPTNITVSDYATLPIIDHFTADTFYIPAGDSVQLDWQVTGTTSSISIDNSIGSVSAVGNQVVSPSNTVSYTLTATNDPHGSVTKTLTIDVSPDLGVSCNDGSGTTTDPYMIIDCTCLQGLNGTTTSNKFYALAGHINCAETTTWNSGAGFVPINDFRGTLDGQDFVVSSLFINRPTTDRVALFEEVKTEGLVKNIEIFGADITGNNYTAGLVADNYGILEKVAFEGTVNANGYIAAGLVGANNGTITNAYSVGQVNGSNVWTAGLASVNNNLIQNVYADVEVNGNGETGGVTSSNNGTVENAFAAGNISGSYYTGSFIGTHYSGTLTNNYWYNHSGNQSSALGYGSGTVTEQTNQNYFYSASNAPFTGWDTINVWEFSGTKYPTFNDINRPQLSLPVINSFTATPELIFGGTSASLAWDITGTGITLTVDNGVGTVTGNIGNISVSPSDTTIYTITATNGAGSITETVTVTINNDVIANCGDGSATQQDPYLINDCTCLQGLASESTVNKFYALAGPINCTETSSWNSGAGFEPIIDFRGTLDGRDHTVMGLYINRPSTDKVALFEEVKTEGTVKNLFMNNVDITGNNYVSAMIADNYGTMTKVTASGTVVANGYKTGLLVSANNGDIIDAYATGTVTGNSVWTGGLVGVNNDVMRYTYSDVTVRGNGETGGLSSNNNGTIEHSFSAGSVSGSYYTGAFIGAHYSGALNNNYWLNGANNSNAAIGYGSATVTEQINGAYFHDSNNEPFTEWDTTNVWEFSGSGFPVFNTVNQVSISAPVINSLTASPDIISSGESSTLAWNITGSGMTLTIDNGIGTVTGLSGSIGVSPSATTTTYELTASNAIGSDTATVTVTVGSGITASCGDGNATSGDPYQITDCDCLQGIKDIATENKYFELAGNINCSATSSWNAGSGFIPITYFQGHLNGQDFSILNLSIDRPSEDRVGLFSQTALGATISNVSVIGADITGQNYVGIIVGDNTGADIDKVRADGTVTSNNHIIGLISGVNNGNITNVYSTGAVDGSISNSVWVGGLVGVNNKTISKSYSSANVTGKISVAGLAGDNNDTISNSFATGDVTGPSNVGSLVGIEYSTSVVNNYWYDHSGNPTSPIGYNASGGSPSATAITDITYFYDPSNASLNTWDTSTVWTIDSSSLPYFVDNSPQGGAEAPVITAFTASPDSIASGGSSNLAWEVSGTNPVTVSINQGVGTVTKNGNINVNPTVTTTYTLTAQNTEGTVNQNITVTVGAGSGAACFDGSGLAIDPWMVIDCQCLQDIGTNGTNLAGYYQLDTHINCAATSTWNAGEGFQPITNFQGHLDGNGYVVNNLIINRPGVEKQALFANTLGEAVITNLGLVNANVTGGTYSALMVSDHYGTIQKSYVSGAVDSNSYINGLMAGVNNEVIEDSYSNGSLNSSSVWNGGFVGVNNDRITRSYSTATVTAGGETGGLSGNNNGNVTDSFATGNVTGSYYTGGFMGAHYRGNLTNNHWYNHSGNPSAGNGYGGSEPTASGAESHFYSQINAPLNNWDFTNVWQENAGAYPTLR